MKQSSIKELSQPYSHEMLIRRHQHRHIKLYRIQSSAIVKAYRSRSQHVSIKQNKDLNKRPCNRFYTRIQVMTTSLFFHYKQYYRYLSQEHISNKGEEQETNTIFYKQEKKRRKTRNGIHTFHKLHNTNSSSKHKFIPLNLKRILIF